MREWWQRNSQPVEEVNAAWDYMITNVPAEPGIEEIQHSTQANSDHKLMIC